MSNSNFFLILPLSPLIFFILIFFFVFLVKISIVSKDINLFPCNGIDCSALIQIYFYYNRIFFPRDTKDQIRFCKRKRNKNRLKGDIVFWKGHVGICLNKSRFIHAYGPKKKVIIMPTGQTIKLIDKTANLKVKKVSNISNI